MGVLFILIGTVYKVSATYTNFAGSADWIYRRVSEVNKKSNTSYNAHIDWVTSDKGNHREYFQIAGGSRNPIYAIKVIEGKALGDQTVETDAHKNDNCYLYASRENVIDPNTYITGTWQP